MTARDDLLAMLNYPEEACTCGDPCKTAEQRVDAYAHELREQWGKEANVILCQALDEHAHDLAEKIRNSDFGREDCAACGGGGDCYICGGGPDAAADLIDPEVNK